MKKRLDKKVGKYIAYRLKSQGITYTAVATSAKLSYSIINEILNSRKRSKRAEAAIAKALGYKSFEDLEAYAQERVRIDNIHTLETNTK